MGAGSWSATDWSSYATSTASKPAAEIYKSRSLSKTLSPMGVNIRESRDSLEHPASNAIIVALDVTGSMGQIAVDMAKNGLGVLFKEILDRKPVSDPHMMFMAVGDVAAYDQAPFQVSQFESDNRIIDQLTEIYIESGGGGNMSESYQLPWYFAAKHTSIDCFEKRKKKGYIFTIGDEQVPGPLTQDQLSKFCDDKIDQPLHAAEILKMAQEKYHVFHIVIEQGSHVRGHGLESVLKSWRPVLGQNVLVLSDAKKLSEVIVSTIQVIEGESVETVASSWDGSTNLVVRNAIGSLTKDGKGKGIKRFK